MHLLALVLCWVLTSCSAPRLFQSKVPEPVVKAPTQIEAERQAADLIAKKIEKPVELKPVAVSLSTSLGVPSKSLVDVRSFDLPVAAEHAQVDLSAGIVQLQKKLDTTNVQLAKLRGKSIDDTGFSLAGPGTLTIIGVLVALGVVFPPAFTLMGIAYRRMKQTTKLIVDQIDEVSDAPENVPAIATIKKNLGDLMDKEHKRVVHSLQSPQ